MASNQSARLASGKATSYYPLVAYQRGTVDFRSAYRRGREGLTVLGLLLLIVAVVVAVFLISRYVAV